MLIFQILILGSCMHSLPLTQKIPNIDFKNFENKVKENIEKKSNSAKGDPLNYNYEGYSNIIYHYLDNGLQTIYFKYAIDKLGNINHFDKLNIVYRFMDGDVNVFEIMYLFKIENKWKTVTYNVYSDKFVSNEDDVNLLIFRKLKTVKERNKAQGTDNVIVGEFNNKGQVVKIKTLILVAKYDSALLFYNK